MNGENFSSLEGNGPTGKTREQIFSEKIISWNYFGVVSDSTGLPGEVVDDSTSDTPGAMLDLGKEEIKGDFETLGTYLAKVRNLGEVYEKIPITTLYPKVIIEGNTFDLVRFYFNLSTDDGDKSEEKTETVVEFLFPEGGGVDLVRGIQEQTINPKELIVKKAPKLKGSVFFEEEEMLIFPGQFDVADVLVGTDHFIFTMGHRDENDGVSQKKTQETDQNSPDFQLRNKIARTEAVIQNIPDEAFSKRVNDLYELLDKSDNDDLFADLSVEIARLQALRLDLNTDKKDKTPSLSERPEWQAIRLYSIDEGFFEFVRREQSGIYQTKTEEELFREEILFKGEMFKAWFRRELYDRVLGVFLGEVPEMRVLLPGFQMPVDIRSIHTYFPKELKDYGVELRSELNAFFTVHQRERVVDENYGDLYKLAEAMTQFRSKMPLTNSTWNDLAHSGEVLLESGRGKQKFSHLLTKALRVYLAFDPENGGTLKRFELRKLGFTDEEIDEAEGLEDPESRDDKKVIVKSFFPSSSSDQRGVIRKLVGGVGVDGRVERMGVMAEVVAYKLAQQGLLGAYLDVGMSATNAAQKPIEASRYLAKAIFGSKMNANPLITGIIGKLVPTYFDFVKIRPDSMTREQGQVPYSGVPSLRRWILATELDQIPFLTDATPTDLDAAYYDNAFYWAAKVYSYIEKGLDVPWAGLTQAGRPGQGTAIDQRHIKTLQDTFKYIGYWVDSLDIDLLREAIVDSYVERVYNPETGEDLGSIIHWVHYSIQEGSWGGVGESGTYTLADGRLDLKKVLLTELIAHELMMHGEFFNDQASLQGWIQGKAGREFITFDDIRDIKTLLSSLNNAEEGRLNSLGTPVAGSSKPVVLFTEDRISRIINRAGLVGNKASARLFVDAVLRNKRNSII